MNDASLKIYSEIAGYIRGRQYHPDARVILKSLLNVLSMAFKDNDMVAMQWIFEKIRRIPCNIKAEAGQVIGVALKVVNPIPTKKLEDNFCYIAHEGITQ